MENLTIKDYSDKAIAVYGETRPHKDALKELGGRFNPHLKDGAGWIFSKSKTDAVKAYIESKYNATLIPPSTIEGEFAPFVPLAVPKPEPAACTSTKSQKSSTKRSTKVIVEGWLNGEIILPNSKVEKYVKDTMKAKNTFFDNNPHSEETRKLKFIFVNQ
jgi:hypothetical protein